MTIEVADTCAGEFETKHRRTNEEFVSELMCYSRYGPLTQAFIIEAIRYYSEIVSKNDVESNPNAIIDPKLWQMIAEDVHQQMVKNYE